jgi:hypothetical protein
LNNQKDDFLKKNNHKAQIYKIGVTGHRFIEDEDLIRNRVREVIRYIEYGFSDKDHILKVISPLAEGADRIVAQEVLKFQDGPYENEMRVVLPLEKDEYMDDFKTIESKEEFINLLNQAKEVITLPETPTRKDAYLQVGEYVVDESDVLIAIWDGKPSRGKGGTADIIGYAKSIGREVVWINSKSGEIIISDYG